MRTLNVQAPVERWDLPVPGVRGDREDSRARTRDLINLLRHATPLERRAIRDEVVSSHLWLAASAARRFGSNVELDDLVQVARMGLIEAFDRFDPEQSSYSNFAWLTINGLLRRHLRDLGWSVRPPRALQESATVVRATLPALSQELGRDPRAAEVAERLGWTVGAVREAQLADQGLRAVSVEAMAGDAWVPEQPDDRDDVELRVMLARALRALSDDERLLLRLRYVDELSQVRIAAVLKTNQMGVSRRLGRLLPKLRAQIGELDEHDVTPGAGRR